MNSNLTEVFVERKFLLLTSRVKPDAFDFERAQEMVNQNINWDILLPLSNKHGTAVIVYKNLLELKNVPLEVIEKFSNLYKNLLRKNIIAATELDRIIDRFKENGINVISLKGVTASETIFGDIGLYPSGDMDFLIRKEDIDKVWGILEDDGYHLNDVGFNEYRDYFMKEHYHINLSKGRFTVEPHWNLFMRYFSTPPEFWWEESITVSAGEKNYRLLSPEKNVFYTAFRLFSKGFTRLRFIVIIAEAVRYYREVMDWDKLFGYAGEYKFINTLRVVLKLCRELLGAPVPEQYAKIETMRAKVLYYRAKKMVFIEDDIHPMNKALFAFLRDDFTGTVGVLLKRLFPSMGEIVSRYRLREGSLKAKAYYIFNPLLLLARRHQK